MHNDLKSYNLFVGALLVIMSLPVTAQDTFVPDIVPAIQRDIGTTHQIEISNKSQNAPIAISGSLTLGAYSYGNGYLTLKNVSLQPVVAIRGAWEVIRANTQSLRQHWDVGGPTLVFNGGLQPGEEISFPIPGPPNNVAEKNQRLINILPVITGVVFYDKSTWGMDGDSIVSKLARDQKIFVSIAERVRDASVKLSPREFTERALERDFSAPDTTAFFPDLDFQMMFSNIILDENQLVRVDAADRLARVTEKLKQF